MISKNMGRVSAFFIALILSCVTGDAQAALSVIFRGDFESGTINTPATASTFPIDTFFAGGSPAPDSNGNCTAGGNNTSLYTSNRIVTDVVRNGTYANAQTLYWECDYRPLNGGANGLQKPRNSLEMENSAGYMTIGKTYWFGFSFRLPVDWISDKSSLPINLWQSHKSSPRTHPAKMDILEAANTLSIELADIAGNTNSQEVYTWPTNPGEWNDIIVKFKPCYSGSSSCGATQIYLANDTRRNASADVTVPVYSDTGPNTETASTATKMTANVYKYNWHCTGSLRSNYSACMVNPPPSGTDTYNATLGKALPITAYYDDMIIAEAADTDTITDAIAVLNPTFVTGSSAPSTPEITRMNQDNPLTPSTYAYFTGNGLDMRGAIAARLTDGTNIETADGITTNLVSGGNGGGCVTFGSLPSLNTGAVTFQLDYDNPDYDSENDAPNYTSQEFLSWSKSNATIASYTGTDPCFNAGGAVLVSNSGGNALITPQSVDQLDGLVSGNTLTARFEVEPDPTNTVSNYRYRIQCDSGYVQAQGSLGSLTLAGSPTLSGGAATGLDVNETSSRGHTFIKMTATLQASDNNCHPKAGINESGTKAFRLYHVTMTKNESVNTVSYATTLNKPDTTPPTIDAELNALPDYGANISWNLSETATVYAMVSSSSTPPNSTQIVAGNDSSGSAAMCAQTITNASLIGSVDCPPLYRYVTKYAYVYAVDPASLNSGVITAVNTIPAETLTLSKAIKLASGEVISRAGKAWTGKVAKLCLYDSHPLLVPGQTPLACFNSISVSAGNFNTHIGTGQANMLLESDAEVGSGSLSALSTGTTYYMGFADGTGNPYYVVTTQLTTY